MDYMSTEQVKKRVYRMSLAEISAALDAGNIALDVGDMIIAPHKMFGDLNWTVIGKGIDAQRVGDSRQTVTLHMTHVPDGAYMPFDIPCKDYRWGHNAWKESSARKWLNGEFLAGFRKADQNVMRFAEKVTFRSDGEGGGKCVTRDKLFLLSASEVGFRGNEIKGEGSVYPLYEEPENRGKTDAPSGDGSWWWLRSPVPWYADYVRGVTPDGSLNVSIASHGTGAAAACVI